MSLTPTEIAKLEALNLLTDATGLVVLDHGKVVLEKGDAKRRLELMSVTKSIVSLLFGQLVEGKLVRLDQSVADFVPEWAGTPKAGILVAHLLANTSGLDDKRTTEDIYASDDFVRFAIAADLKHPPGTSYFYSNRASNLLALVAKSAAGVPLDQWAAKHLFEPLGIHDVEWSHDKAGNVQVMAGLHLSTRELASIGELVLEGGRNVVPADWIARTTAYLEVGSQPHGLLWWLVPESTSVGFSQNLFDRWKASGMPEDFIAKFRPLEGRYYPRHEFFAAVYEAMTGRKKAAPTDADLAQWYKMTWQAGRPDGEPKYGEVGAIVADGYGGQYLAVLPKRRVVVARLREVRDKDGAKELIDFAAVVKQILL